MDASFHTDTQTVRALTIFLPKGSYGGSFVPPNPDSSLVSTETPACLLFAEEARGAVPAISDRAESELCQPDVCLTEGLPFSM